MIVVPEAKPNSLSDVEVDFETTISSSIWKKIIRQINWVNANVPVGIIMWFYQSQNFADPVSQIPAPNSSWQFCDGSLINDPDSPLNGINTPDLRDLFLKGQDDSLALAGAETIDLAHNHTGFTAFETDLESGNTRTDFGFEKAQGNTHRHPILTALAAPISLLPQYVELQAYMRIK